MRKFRVIHGIAYPRLIPGDNPTKFVRANLKDRNSFYHDDAIRLSEADIERFSGLVGHPICVEHDESRVVGDIFRAWKDDEGKMRIMARIYLDSEDGQWADQQLRSGNLKGLSVGYGAQVEYGIVQAKQMKEISLCKEPFFDGAYVTVAASKKGSKTENYTSKSDDGSISKLVILIDAMASNEQQQVQSTIEKPQVEKQNPPSHAPPTPAPAVSETLGDKDAGEVSKQAAAIFEEAQREKQRNEELAKKNKEMEARLAAFEAAEQQRQLEYAKQRKAEVDDVVQTTQEMIKEAYGENAVLPEEYKGLVEDLGLAEQNAHLFKPITASATLHKKYKASLAEKEKQLEEMRKQLETLKKDQQVGLAALHSASSRRAALGLEDEQMQTTSQVAIAASKEDEMSAPSQPPSRFVVPKPSAVEKFLLSREQGYSPMSGSVSINASGAIEETETTVTRTYVPAPGHRQLEHVKFSARHRFPELFSHLASGQYDQVPTKLEHSYNPNIYDKREN